MHTSNRKSGFVESSFWHWLLPSWPAWGGSPHCNMARGQSAHNPVEEHRNFVLWVQVLKSIFGIPKKSKAPFLSSLDCNWKRWVHSATLLSCVAVTTNKKRKWNTNLSFWFWNWLSSVQCQINWIDLLGGIVRQHVLSLPFQLFVFCIFAVVLFFFSLPGRGRGGDNPWDTVSYLVLSHSHSGEQHLREIQGNDRMYHITYI